MSEIESGKLLEMIKSVFENEDKYQMRKIIEEFQDNGEFIGDYFNFLMFEKPEVGFPIFYHVLSPYDLVSKKDPQQAIVWQGGEMLLNIDFTDYVAMRTGAMDAFSLLTLGVKSLESKNVLMFGTGRTAKWSAETLKATYPELSEIQYINSTNSQNIEFEKDLGLLGINSVQGSKENIGKSDYIFCHTNTKENLLELNELNKLKENVVITTYISSGKSGELSEEFFNSSKFNIVLDWKGNLERFVELKGAQEKGIIKTEDVIFLKDLINNKELVGKRATIFRYLGTPMQNLAVLKCLV